MFQFKKINHVTLLVKSKIDSEKFYTEIGFEKAHIGKSLWLRVGEQFVHISENFGNPVKKTFYHFVVEVNELKSFWDHLMAKGINVKIMNSEGNIISSKEYPVERKHFFINDIDGNLIEFIESKNSFFNPK